MIFVPRSFPSRFLIAAVAAAIGVSAQPAASAKAPLAFEVASIRPAQALDPAKVMSGQMRVGMKVDGARAEFHFMSLADLICLAYKIKAYQLQGPDWMKQQRYDIQAGLPEGSNKDQVPEMLQSMLAERFKLVVHRDKKEHEVYALIPGKNGPKLKEAEPDEPAPAAAENGDSSKEAADAKDAKGAAGGMTVNGEKMTFKQDGRGGAVMRGGGMGTTKVSMNNGMIHMEFGKVDMPRFTEMLTGMTDRPVIDETGLKGNYQVVLDLSMNDMMNVARRAGMGGGVMVAGPGGGPPPPGAFGGGSPGGAAAGPAASASDPGGGSSIFTAVEQMGLKLQPKKGPVDLIVVDKAEKTPTDN